MSTIEKNEGDQKKEVVSSKKKLLLWVSTGFILIAGGFLWWFLQGKAVGTIRVKDLEGGVSLEKKSEKKLYKGKFITFSHEAGYMEKSHSLPESGPVQETVFLSTLDVEGRKIAVTVTYRGTDDLTSEPAFQLRQGTPAEYQSKKFQEGVWQGVLFAKNTAPFERTGFFSDKGFIIGISITSPFSGDDLEEEVFMIIKSLSFSFE